MLINSLRQVNYTVTLVAALSRGVLGSRLTLNAFSGHRIRPVVGLMSVSYGSVAAAAETILFAHFNIELPCALLIRVKIGKTR